MCPMSAESTQCESEIKACLLDSTRYDAVEEALPASDGGYPMPRELTRFLARIVVMGRRRSVLEFGAGQSSIALARALHLAGGGRLTSVDHMPEYCTDAWAQVARVPSVDAQLVLSRLRLQLRATGLLWSYVDARPATRARAPYDLVVIDAPPREWKRDASLHLALRYLRNGALVVLDDAARAEEKASVRHWLCFYPGMQVLLSEPSFARGVVVLRHDGNKRRRICLRPIVGSLLDQYHRWRSGRHARPGGAVHSHS